MTLAVINDNGVLGKITLNGDELTGSNAGVQSMADAAVRRAGSAAGGYADLSGQVNGYISVIELPETIGLAGDHFNPLEARNPHGEWTRGPGGAALHRLDGQPAHGYHAPDPARLISKRSPYANPGDHPFFRKHPVSAANVVKVYDQSTQGERAQGARWYADAHNIATAIAGGSPEKGAGLLAAYSPQVSWPQNMFNASRTALEGRALGPGDGLITGAIQRTAQKILDGATIDEALKAPKTNSFAHLILSGGDAPEDHLGKVVVDRHAMSVAVGGHRMTRDDLNSAPIGDARYYQHVADAYRQASIDIAKRDGIEVPPYQLQAITWLHQQAANQEQDAAAGASRLQRGRTTNTRKNWAAWQEYQRAHHIPVNPGTTSLSGQALAGDAIELAMNLLDAGWEPWEIDPEPFIELGWHDAWMHETRGRGGQWIHGLDVSGSADLMMKNREGFSVNLQTGQAPVHGFMVAQTGRTHTFPESILDDHEKLTGAIDAMLMDEHEAFSGGQTHLGGWVHDGKLWLEPSDNIGSRDQAIQAGKARNQIAIWDVDGGQEIDTGGSGGGKITEHDASGAVTRTYTEGGDGGGTGELPGAATGSAAGNRGPAGSAGARRAGPALDIPLPPDPNPPTQAEVSTRQAATSFATAAAGKIPGLLGGGHEAFTGRVTLFTKAEEGGWLQGEMTWKGDMRLRLDMASAISRAQESPPKPALNPQAFAVVLHELIHGNVPEGTQYRDGMKAYQDEKTASVEEGFTELATINHAPEFLDQMGIGGQETMILAPDASRHATLSEYARRVNDPQRIASGDAWGHYPVQTALAQTWVQEVAKAEGLTGTGALPRMIELSDEINRQGTAGKLGVMAMQAARASGVTISPADLASVEASIRDEWGTSTDVSGIRASAAFRAARQRARAAAERSTS